MNWWILISAIIALFGIVPILALRRKRILGQKELLIHRLGELNSEAEVMKEKLVIQKQEMRIRDRNSRDHQWITDGYTFFNSYISRHKSSLQTLLNGVSAELARYLQVCHTSFFLFDEKGQTLVFVAGYAPLRGFSHTFDIAEASPLCDCVREGRNVVLRKIEKNDYLVGSGLGDESLRNVTFVPLNTNDRCLGAVIIGSFSKIPDPAVNLTERVASLLSANLANILVREKSDKILAELNLMSEELMTQKEELRQNLEEYSATKEEIDRKEQSLLELNKQFELTRNRLDNELKASRREISRLLKACSAVEEENARLSANINTPEA